MSLNFISLDYKILEIVPECHQQGVGFEVSHSFVDLNRDFPAAAILPVSYNGDVTNVGSYLSRIRITIAQVEFHTIRNRYEHASAKHVCKLLSTSLGQTGIGDFSIGTPAQRFMSIGVWKPLNEVLQSVIGITRPQSKIRL